MKHGQKKLVRSVGNFYINAMSRKFHELLTNSEVFWLPK